MSNLFWTVDFIGLPGKLCLALVICSCLRVNTAFAQDDKISPSPSEEQVDINDPFNLSALRDHDWLASDENSAYYGLLNLANEQSQDELIVEAKKFIATRKGISKLPTFVDMLRNPKAFRGKPVRLKGHVLQTLEYDAEENKYGIKKLYESALFTDDSQSHPTTIIFLNKPENLPIGGELIDRVTVNGYFLKIYVYPPRDQEDRVGPLKNRVAPLILAKTVSVAAAPPTRSGLHSPVVYVVIGIVFAMLIIGMIAVQRSDRKRVLAAQQKRLDENSPQFENMSETL